MKKKKNHPHSYNDQETQYDPKEMQNNHRAAYNHYKGPKNESKYSKLTTRTRKKYRDSKKGME